MLVDVKIQTCRLGSDSDKRLDAKHLRVHEEEHKSHTDMRNIDLMLEIAFVRFS